MARPPAQYDAYQLRYISFLLRSSKGMTPNPEESCLASCDAKFIAEHVKYCDSRQESFPGITIYVKTNKIVSFA